MSGSWECEDCLFANLSSSKTCGMCEAPRVEEEEKTPTAPNQRGDQDAVRRGVLHPGDACLNAAPGRAVAGRGRRRDGRGGRGRRRRFGRIDDSVARRRVATAETRTVAVKPGAAPEASCTPGDGPRFTRRTGDARARTFCRHFCRRRRPPISARSNGAVADENENENETISETASLNLQGAPDVPDDISEEGTQASRTGSLAPTMDSSVMAVADDLSDTQSLLSLRSARTGVGGSVLEEEEDDDDDEAWHDADGVALDNYALMMGAAAKAAVEAAARRRRDAAAAVAKAPADPGDVFVDASTPVPAEADGGSFDDDGASSTPTVRAGDDGEAPVGGAPDEAPDEAPAGGVADEAPRDADADGDGEPAPPPAVGTGSPLRGAPPGAASARRVVSSFHVCSEQGRRPTMEDVYCVNDSIHDDSARAFFAVFDGHAGSRAAEYCGQRLLDNTTATAAWKRGDAAAAVRYGIKRTEQAYLRAALSAQPRWFDGTTAVVCLVQGLEVTIGWVGDSRAVLGSFDDKRAVWAAHELSRDHKPNEPKELQRIVSAGGTVGRSITEANATGPGHTFGQYCPAFCFGVHPSNPVRCYPGGLSLSRSIGDVCLKYHPTKCVVGEPDVVQRMLDPTLDRFVILACDGIWDVISNDLAVEIVVKAVDRRVDTARALVKSAAALGSTDNMTAIVIHFSD